MLPFGLPGYTIDFHKGWLFHRGDLPPQQAYWGLLKNGTCNQGGSRYRLDDSQWRQVTLPHDYVVETSVVEGDDTPNTNHGLPEMWTFNQTHNYRGSFQYGPAWYRKRFGTPELPEGGRVYLMFDGIYRASDIYLNDCFVLHHESGYTGITADVTDFLFESQENVLAVRVDATEAEGWYYEGGGIYRSARLVVVPAVHFELFETFVSTKRISPHGLINVKTSICNVLDCESGAELRFTVMDPGGSAVAEGSQAVSLPVYGSAEAQLCFTVPNPRLWTMEDPALYTVKIDLVIDGAAADSVTQPFGIRTAVFDAKKGFLLNGKPVKLKGACCHQDHAGVGVAVPESVWEYRVKALLEMGSNALRTAHHPPAPELMAACDRMGMLVMCENRLLSVSDDNLAQYEQMIKSFRNCPSVVIWSTGNEEEGVQYSEIGRKTALTLKKLSHKLDPTRPVTLAIPLYRWLSSEEEPIDVILPLPDSLDVMGFNYAYFAWNEFTERFPDKPVVITEDTTQSGTRGGIETDGEHAVKADTYEEHEVVIGRLCERWERVDKNPALSGTFLWTGFDYRGETVPYLWPAISSQFGLMDTCGFPKDMYWYFKSLWSNQPMVYFTPHWTLGGIEDKFRGICCYTNCPQAELFINGKSQGVQEREPYRTIVWKDVSYEPGEAAVVGLDESGRKLCEYRCRTAGAPERIMIRLQNVSSPAAGDAAIFEVSVTDGQGTVVPYASNLLSFAVEGGQFLGAGNGDPASHEQDTHPVRRAYGGLCQAIALITEPEFALRVTSHGLQPATYRVEAKP